MVGLGLKIKKVREIKNFTQEHMAKQLGVSQSTYSSYESPFADVNPDIVDRIAKILEVTKEQIESFDEQVIFSNNTLNDSANGLNYCPTINQYLVDSKIEKLYEDKIQLLEEKIKALEKEFGR